MLWTSCFLLLRTLSVNDTICEAMVFFLSSIDLFYNEYYSCLGPGLILGTLDRHWIYISMCDLLDVFLYPGSLR